MLFFDTFILFSGVAVLLLIAGLALRDVRKVNSSKYLVCMAITVAATLLGYTPETIHLPQPLLISFKVIDVTNLIFVWLFGLSLFNDDFEMKGFHLGVALMYTFFVILLRLQQFGFVEFQALILLIIIDIIALCVVVHLVLVTLSGRKDDLLESRRKGRFYFVIGLASTITLFTLADILVITSLEDYIPSVKTLIVLPAIIWGGYWLLRVSPESLKFEARKKSDSDSLSYKNKQLLEKLHFVMHQEKAYLISGLTIEALAVKVGSTPHALRTLINGHLGHRHFSGYINSLRIAHVKNEFQNPEKKDVPILTIALEAGYNSISPFNRAFKQTEGMTPSEFRSGIEDT